VTATASAVLALNILEETSILGGVTAIVDWVADRQATTEDSGFIGGFEESLLTNDTNLVTTYWALNLLSTVNGLAEINTTSVASFILECQAPSGGFGIVPDAAIGKMYPAYEAVAALGLLGEQYSNMIYQPDPNNPDLPLVDWRLLVVIGIIIAAAVIAIFALRLD
jgi:prenyltransferase beta subunit